MHLSEARQNLYQAIEQFEQQRKDATMSRLHKEKGYYHAGETEELEPVGWSTTQHGYLQRVEVTYRIKGTPDLRTLHEDVVGYPGQVEETLSEMLKRTSTTHPD